MDSVCKEYALKQKETTAKKYCYNDNGLINNESKEENFPIKKETIKTAQLNR